MVSKWSGREVTKSTQVDEPSRFDARALNWIQECEYRLNIVLEELQKPQMSKGALDKLDRTINGFGGPYYGLKPENERRSFDQLLADLSYAFPEKAEHFRAARVAIHKIVPLVMEVHQASAGSTLEWDSAHQELLDELSEELAKYAAIFRTLQN